MEHRHLNTDKYTPAAVDDIIYRGGRNDYVKLRDAINADPEIAETVKKVCLHYAGEGSLRHDFWLVWLAGHGYLPEKENEYEDKSLPKLG